MNFLFILLAASGLGSGVRAEISEAVPLRSSTTSFTCRGKAPGYYADLETGCKTYHVCDGVTHFTYVCPRRTLFQESSRICDHSHLVHCGEGAGSVSRDEEQEIRKKLGRREENKRDGIDRVEIFTPKETSPHTESTDIPAVHFDAATPAFGTTKQAATTQKAPSEPTAVAREENYFGRSIKNFLKFRLKDLRALFFIPELSNNSVAVEPERELVVPLEKGDLVRFRSKKKASGSFSACPAYCNPRFFLPGTCHPCIMIK